MLSFEAIGETTMSDSYIPDSAPVLSVIKRHGGIAGQFSVSVDVTYPNEPIRHVTFTGSVYGGPVVAQFGNGPQTFITRPERHGNFSTDPIEWVVSFFA